MGIVIRSPQPYRYIWNGPVIPYNLHPHLTNPERIKRGIFEFEALTRIRFVIRYQQKNWILFQHGQQCDSLIGKRGGKQTVNLRTRCSVPEVIHEIGHAIGMAHEHQRPDRDDYVEVHRENISPGKGHNFSKLNRLSYQTCTSYDNASIMHYNSHAFAKGHEPTLSSKTGQILNNSSTLTSYDIKCINEFYSHVGIVRRGDSSIRGAGSVREIAIIKTNHYGVITATLDSH